MVKHKKANDMELSQLFSKRNNSGQNYAQPIIYEWEDEISKEMNIPIRKYPFVYKLLNRLNIHKSLFGPNKYTFRYVINGRDNDEPMNSKYVVPCIIDFFENENMLLEFYQKHSNNKVIFVSSPFDYYYLKRNNCPVRVELLPYSIPDKYGSLESEIEKKYDIVLTGRQDPILYSFFVKYIKHHPNVTYVKRGKDLDNDMTKTKDYYLNGKECIGAINTRDEFMRLQASGKVTLYGVQGYIDDATKGFFHMTPHFLEIIACYCHVLIHYPQGPEGVDAQFYEFDKFSPSINTYEDFEKAMNLALNTDIDTDKYSTYLQKHYTSNRVKQIKEILINVL